MVLDGYIAVTMNDLRCLLLADCGTKSIMDVDRRCMTSGKR